MKSHNGLFVNLALMVIGVGIALVLVEFTLRTFPELVPDQVRVNPPVRRVKANIDEIYVLRHSDGDLLYWMRGAFPPIPQDEDAVISRVHMIIDAHGFRNPPPERTTYEIVALGDSYTRGSLVEAPWPENLAELTGYTVINLADVGFGPQEEFDTLRRYGIEKKPQWVVLAYFEGNDLYDAAAYEQSNPFIFLRLGKFMLTQSIEAWQRRSDVIASRAVAPNYRYPIELNLNNSTQDMVFFSPYISWLTPDRQAIETSLNYRLVKQTLSEIMELCAGANARFMLVYIPTKEHIYLPLVNDSEALEKIYKDVFTIMLDQAGYLQFSNQRATQETTLRYIEDQANLMADLASEMKIDYLDLTSDFREATESGSQLYYTYDSHWNQAGHDLAAERIAGYINSQ